jgi:hypothetical protein
MLVASSGAAFFQALSSQRAASHPLAILTLTEASDLGQVNFGTVYGITLT